MLLSPLAATRHKYRLLKSRPPHKNLVLPKNQTLPKPLPKPSQT
jgi:hypothetical protein